MSDLGFLSIPVHGLFRMGGNARTTPRFASNARCLTFGMGYSEKWPPRKFPMGGEIRYGGRTPMGGAKK